MSEKANSAEQTIMTTCSSHCGGTCILKAHVKDGKVTRIETDDGPDPQFRACLKARAYRQRVYAPDRLQYPLKRVGERGKGQFERVSWDEALGAVAEQLKRVRATYGSASVLFLQSGGDVNWLHSYKVIDRLLCMSGGCTRTWGLVSYEGALFSSIASYGEAAACPGRDDLLNSRFILLWGCDPSSSVANTNHIWYLAQAREKGIKIVAVDPRYHDSAAVAAEQWVPIRPGTDAAVLLAMAYVIISEHLQDKRFIDTYTVGFDKYADHVLGKDDGTAKTPAWAETITGIPAATIASLAREFATRKPAALISGIGPGRTAYGEQYHRAATALAAITGNVGVHGGEPAARSWDSIYNGYPFQLGRGISSGGNPVEAGAPPRQYSITGGGARMGTSGARIHITSAPDAILKGKAGGYPADIKLAYLVNINYLNQTANLNKTVEAFKKLEFVVVQEQFMTATAKFADIVLPTNTFFERNDFTAGGGTPFYGAMNKIVPSLYESKSHLEIGIALAAKMGLKDFNDKTEEEWLRGIAKAGPFKDYDSFKKEGSYKVPLAEPFVTFKEQIDDPKGHPFPTPSGRIELFCQRLADMHHPEIPPVPKYIEAWEGVNDPLARKYPLQLITTHSRMRAHTQFHNIPWIRELAPHAVTINARDAKARNIKDGDTVRVFNDRGQMALPARVNERIMPGVVEVPQGAWYDPDERGVDKGGCANVLTSDRVSPGGAFTSNTALVQVEKV